MSNKQSIKLYREEQVKNAIQMAAKHRYLFESEENEIINLLSPIQLPSDEEIGQEFKHGSDNWEVRQALEVGAKWMRDKIQGGNK
jgi:hypothetical protein